MSQTALKTRPATAPMGAPQVATPTRKQLLTSVAATFAKMPAVNFGTLNAIEYVEEPRLRAALVAGTPLEVVDQVLSDAGIATDGTVGAVMDGLKLSRDDLHAIVCNCLGDIVTGDVAADRFAKLASAA